MCGPACPVQPGFHGATQAHVHPVCSRTDKAGFPKHHRLLVPSHTLRPLPKAYTTFDHRNELRRPKHGLNYPRGAVVDDANASSVQYFRHLSNQENVQVAQRQAMAHPQRNVSDGANALSIQDSRHFTATVNASVVRRQPATHGPNLTRAISSAATTKGSGYFSRMENARGKLVVRNASSSRGGISLASGSSRYLDNIELQTFSSVRTRESRQSSRVSETSSLRSGALSRLHIKRYRSGNAVYDPEMRQADNDPDECFTLRHIQRMACERVQRRIRAISESYSRLRWMLQDEDVDGSIFDSIARLQAAKAALDSNNQRYGGSEDEEGAWKDFLLLLQEIEGDIQKEFARLEASRDAKHAKRLDSEEQILQQEDEDVEEELEDFVQRDNIRKSYLSCESYQTARESLTIDSIPAVHTGLTRSLSCPPESTLRQRASSF